MIGSKRQLRFGVAHTAGQIDETKTVSSKAKLPLAPALAELLLGWKMQSEFDWIFANPATGMPYMSPSLQQRRIRPAGEPLGIEGLGFHSLRHSYRSWLDSVGAAPGITKDLMRHSAIATTFNVYGRAMSDEKREANSKVVNLLLSNAMLEIPILDRASGCGKCNRRPSQKVGKGGARYAKSVPALCLRPERSVRSWRIWSVQGASRGACVCRGPGAEKPLDDRSLARRDPASVPPSVRLVAQNR